MSIKKRVLLGTLGIGALLTAFSCNQTDGVGDPCVPESELDPTKNGFAIDEVSVEARSVQCASRLCLVNHFQGRVSCPLGQTAGDGTCLVPGTTEPVTVDVKAWDLDRPADTAVYCS